MRKAKSNMNSKLQMPRTRICMTANFRAAPLFPPFLLARRPVLLFQFLFFSGPLKSGLDNGFALGLPVAGWPSLGIYGLDWAACAVGTAPPSPLPWFRAIKFSEARGIRGGPRSPGVAFKAGFVTPRLQITAAAHGFSHRCTPLLRAARSKRGKLSCEQTERRLGLSKLSA